MMSGNLELKLVANNAIEMDGMKVDTDYLSGAPVISVQQTDIQSNDNKANLQDCRDGIATSADNPTDPLNTFSHIEANMESSTSGDGMPAAKHTAGISDDTEDTGHRPSITTSSNLKVASAIRSSDTKKYSGWFQCPDCGQKVRGKAMFRSHMKLLHSGSSKTKTVVKRNTSRFKCGERVKGKKNLSQHCFFAHKGQTRIKNIAKTKKNCSSNPPRCAVFADSTSQRSTYVEKSNTEIKHLRLGPWFTCRSCDHIFKGRSQLQEHVRLKHQGLNETCKIQPSIPQITHSAKSEQCQGSGDRKLMDEAGAELAPECPVGNQDGESVVGSNEKELSHTKHRIWHQCDLCGVKVEGRKKLQRHIGKCKGKKQTTPTVMTLQTSLSAYETSATINRSWYKCKHCCRHFRGKKRFMQHIPLCVKAPQHGAALWHRMSHLKQCAWYRCSGCQHTFKGKKRIQLHAFECHTGAQSSCPSVENGKQSFEKRSGHTCTLCQKHFQRWLYLDKHMRKCQGRQRKINLSEQGSIDDLQSSEHRLGQEQAESCGVRDDNAHKGQTIEKNDESRALKTQVDGDASSQLTLVFLQDGSWYKCEICGQNLRGKEQIKKHSHDQNNKELESLNTSCSESEFLKVGSWHGCKICGKKLRGKEQVKSHAHAHKIRNHEQQELHNVTGLESNFLKVGTWRRCKVCGENLRGKEQVKNHSHDLKVVNPDDGKTECPNLSPPCLDFIQFGTWYSCKVCGQKLQGRKQMQAHSHSQPVDDKVQGNSLGTGIQNGLRSVEDGFIQVGSWYTCKSCRVRYRGRHSAEVHHRYKCFLGVGGDCHKDLLPEHQPEHCSDPIQGQDGVLCHDVQPTRDDIAHDTHQPTCDDIAHDIHQPTSDDIAHDIHQPTCDDIAHDIHQPTSDDIAHDIHQPTSDDIAHDIHQPTSDDQQVMTLHLTSTNQQVMTCSMTITNQQVMTWHMTSTNQPVMTLHMTSTNQPVMTLHMTSTNQPVMTLHMTSTNQPVMTLHMTSTNQPVMTLHLTSTNQQVMTCSMTCTNQQVMCKDMEKVSSMVVLTKQCHPWSM
ncbi:zinc finger protein 521-like [Haliotis rubra]|uniref:zinc finger protein 521-like n=1 Tax=Haliotis rubra TaxID=36100 RepID=UPI001EE4F4E4|nr:zinc finger protein 521-like [Haliotis rubra]